MKELILIAAVAENKVIGYKGKVPWHYKEDLKHFRELTLGHPIIMGRKTYESIGKPLDRRFNIILTKNSIHKQNGIIAVSHSLEEAIETCNDGEIYVIGGEKVYKEAILHPLAKRLEITHIHRGYKGDAFFPKIDRMFWILNENKVVDRSDYSFVTYNFRDLPF